MLKHVAGDFSLRCAPGQGCRFNPNRPMLQMVGGRRELLGQPAESTPGSTSGSTSMESRGGFVCEIRKRATTSIVRGHWGPAHLIRPEPVAILTSLSSLAWRFAGVLGQVWAWLLGIGLERTESQTELQSGLAPRQISAAGRRRGRVCWSSLVESGSGRDLGASLGRVPCLL